MSEWTRKTIAECAANEPYSTQIGPFGKALTPEEYTLSGVPLLRGVNVNHGRFYDDGFVFISEETADRLYKYESYPGDVLLVHKGTLGQIGLMPHNRKYHRYIMGNSMLRVRCDETKLIPEYLYYWLCSREGQHYLFSRVSQVGVPQIQKPLATLREASLLVPPIDEQKSITRILETLDTKIENLRRQNETLEKIAQTLFKHWFIDFEFPNDDGKPYKSSGGAMVASELGDIPAGWRLAYLDEYVNVINGYSYKGVELAESDTALINLKNFDRKGGFRVDGFKSLKTDNYKKQHIVFPDDLIVAHTDLTQNAEVLGNAVLVQPSEKYNKYILSMDLVKLESKKDFLNNFFFYYLLSTREFKGHCVGYSNGTTVLHLSKKAIPEYTFPISDEIDIISNFQNIAYVARKKITNNTQQIQTLTKTRDTLLPKLMSGQIRVKDSIIV
jgi:type I restriction enzyme S subunit